MTRPLIYPSLTRISPLEVRHTSCTALPKSRWATGDYVVCQVRTTPRTHHVLELPNGRMRPVVRGDRFVGALGVRHATLEATGTWREATPDSPMHLLTSAGLVGVCTSRSPYISALMKVQYEGHVHVDSQKATMPRFVVPHTPVPFDMPVVLLVGTSMSAGKTTAARVLVRRLIDAGLRVVGSKLAGAGRLRDIQSMADAGAEWVFDFVDVGLPSTVVSPSTYRDALQGLLMHIMRTEADVAVVEIGSSPLEPYNGAAAIAAIRAHVRTIVLCASDPYAAVGVTHAFDLQPSLISGIATNTIAGLDLLNQLCDAPAANLLDPDSTSVVDRVFADTLGDLFPDDGPPEERSLATPNTDLTNS